MAKFCTNCGNELADNAAMCVNCGKLVEGGNTTSSTNGGKKKKGLPTWAIVLIVLGCIVLIPIIIFVVLGIIGYNIIKDIDLEDDLNNYIQDNNKVITGTIGDTLSDGDLKITLDKALMYSSIKGQYFTDTPAEGKEYLVFYFEVENISDENEYISSYDFDGYADGYTVDTKYLMNDINGVEVLSSNLAPGMKTSGFVAFEVNTTWQDFEVHFDANAWNNNKTLVFKVINEDNSNKQGA